MGSTDGVGGATGLAPTIATTMYAGVDLAVPLPVEPSLRVGAFRRAARLASTKDDSASLLR